MAGGGCMGFARACKGRRGAEFSCSSDVRRRLGSVRTSYRSQGHGCAVSSVFASDGATPVGGEGSLQPDLLLGKRDPLRSVLLHVIWFAWYGRQWLQSNGRRAFVESGVSSGMSVPLLRF